MAHGGTDSTAAGPDNTVLLVAVLNSFMALCVHQTCQCLDFQVLRMEFLILTQQSNGRTKRDSPGPLL